jgi:hypothetical protein
MLLGMEQNISPEEKQELESGTDGCIRVVSAECF